MVMKMAKSFMTVVFEMSDDATQKQLFSELKKIFPGVAGDLIRVTALSCRDEMTKLDLIEFGRNIEDIGFINKVIDVEDVTPLLEVMRKCEKYAIENGCTMSHAYEKHHFN
jgi:hypothetical protein